MARRDTRMKASDEFREANFLLANKGTFDEAFPGVADISIEVEEDGDGVSHWRGKANKRTYRKPHLPGEYVNCSNPTCYNGGVSIGSILRHMVREGLTEYETYEICQGYEGSPKGRRKYRDCINEFNIRIAVEYKKSSDSEPSEP